MAFARAHISGDIITWGRLRANLGLDDLAQSLKLSDEKLAEWEAEESLPTLNQAQNLAKKLSIPFGYLFLSEIPDLEPQIADLRTIRSEERNQFSTEFEEILNDCLRKQNWYREQLLQTGSEALSFIGKYSLDDDYKIIAEDIRNTLGLNFEFRRTSSSWENFLTKFIERVEDKGVLVLRNGVVKNNTRKKLSLSEFRGFVLTDPIAPLIFINNNDAQAAKIFTLAHELAHLWIGESGVTNVNPGRQSDLRPKRIERFCNKIAAEVLVPREDFLAHWDNGAKLNDNLNNLARFFRVSPLVILIKAKECSKVERDVFFEVYDIFSVRKKQKAGGGGNPYNTFPVRNSKLFTRTLLASTLEGSTLHRDAARLLGIKVPTLHSLAHQMEIR